MVGRKTIAAAEKVLVVDDEPHIVELIAACLETAGYDVVTAPNGTEGLKAFFQYRPALVLLDIMMPGMDGFQVVQRIREMSSTVPVIFLSAKASEDDKVRGLRLGSDDFIAKPVGMKELLARVQAALRRARLPAAEEQDTGYRDAVLTIDTAAHRVYVRGAEIEFTPLEYGLLLYLAQNCNKALTTDQILDRVWGENYESVDVVKWYISQLRRKVEEDSSLPRLIVTVRGLGYRYERPEPQPPPPPAQPDKAD